MNCQLSVIIAMIYLAKYVCGYDYTCKFKLSVRRACKFQKSVIMQSVQVEELGICQFQYNGDF